MSSNPLIPHNESTSPAVEFIRAKVARVYTNEPSAVKELAEVKHERLLSKHQQFMAKLSASGKSLAEIQTEWHHYYTQLPDHEKHEVWQEFYDANQHTPYQKLFQKQHAANSTPQETQAPTSQPVTSPGGVVVVEHSTAPEPKPTRIAGKSSPIRKALSAQPITTNVVSANSRAATRKLKAKIAGRVSAKGKLTMKHHLQSLGFGLASGFLVLLVFLFTFFNEYIIAPFIQPSRNVSSTPIILGSSTASAEAPPSVTVPKINIQIPIDFTLNSYDETVIETSLKNGAIHYPNTVLPGQNGNIAIFGHSSGNIFNSGKYFFAFTLLHDLTTGDLFYINYGGKTYAYRIFAREIVPPTAVDVITDTKGKQATAELITCDPPGIITNRLVVWGEQISPAPATNTAAAQPTVSAAPAQIAGNGPTLWNRFVGWVEFWN